jgi:hypothetical protein
MATSPSCKASTQPPRRFHTTKSHSGHHSDAGTRNQQLILIVPIVVNIWPPHIDIRVPIKIGDVPKSPFSENSGTGAIGRHNKTPNWSRLMWVKNPRLCDSAQRRACNSFRKGRVVEFCSIRQEHLLIFFWRHSCTLESHRRYPATSMKLYPTFAALNPAGTRSMMSATSQLGLFPVKPNVSRASLSQLTKRSFTPKRTSFPPTSDQRSGRRIRRSSTGTPQG